MSIKHFNSKQEDDEVTLSPLKNGKLELKSILNQLDGYHVDANTIPSVIKQTLHNEFEKIRIIGKRRGFIKVSMYIPLVNVDNVELDHFVLSTNKLLI